MKRRRKGDSGAMVEALADLRSDFEMARETRFKRRLRGVNPSGSGADYHLRESDRLRMIERARDFERNQGLIATALRTLSVNVLQDGIAVDPQTGDDKLDDDLRARFQEWGSDPAACSSDHEHDLHALADMAFRAVIRDGDIAFLPLKDGRLQAIEAHRVRTPSNTRRNVVNGVLLDSVRKRLEYWITKDDIGTGRALTRVSEVDQIPAWDDGQRNVFHVYNPDRVSQTRGLTAFAPIADTVGMHDDIQFARLVQQQIVSCFAIFRSRDMSSNFGAPRPHGAQETETQADGTSRIVEGIAPGLEITGAPGEKLEGFSPNVPNPTFFDHAKLILKFISSHLGLPLQMLLMDGTETNFSGWRGANDEARKNWRRQQRWMISRFYRPIYQFKLQQFIQADAALRSAAERKDINILAHRWNPPQWPYIEPVKDATADVLRQSQGLVSPRRVHRERGQDYQEVTREAISDREFKVRLAKEAASRLNDEFQDKDPVTWRELYGEAPLERLTLTVGAGDVGEQEPSE